MTEIKENSIKELEEAIRVKKVEISEHKKAIERLDKAIAMFTNQIRKLRAAEESAKIEKFWHDLGEEFGVLDNPKFDVLCSKAWEDGHSGGMEDVRNCFINMLELIQ